MITLKEIHKIYSQGSKAFHALKDINLQFKAGETVMIYGKSGCGKTTLLNILGGLDQPTSGNMVIDNKLTTQFKESEWDFFRNHRIGFIFQQFHLIEHLNVIDNVAIAYTIAGKSHKEATLKAEGLLDQVGLKAHAHKKPSELSGGERQRVCIARALINDPDIILADEPTGALDQKNSKAIMDLIQSVGKDKLVVVVTHNMRIAKAYGSRLIELKDGKVVHDSAPGITRVSVDMSKTKKQGKLSFKEGIRIAWFNLLTRKFRTLLVAFGIAIGILGLLIVDTIFSTVRDGISAPSESLRNNPEVLIYSDYDKHPDFDSFLQTLEEAYGAFNDLSLQKQPFSIIRNETENVDYAYPVMLYNYIHSYESEGVYNIHDYFIEGGRFPESEFEFVMPLTTARELINDDLGLTDNEVWEMLQNQTFELGSYYQYTTDLIIIDNVCLGIEDYQDASDLPASFYTMYDSLEAHDLALAPYRSTPLTFQDKTYFCEDYTAFTWYISEWEPTMTVSLTLVGLTNRNHIQKAYFHEDLIESLPFQATVIDPESNAKPLKIRAFVDPEQIDQKASILNQLEDDGYQVVDVLATGYDFLGTLAIFFTYVIQFVFSSIVFIAIITASLMLLLILYISILERKKEIGLLRAMGGTKKDVRTIFVGETLMIGFASGILSILLMGITLLILNTILKDFVYNLLSDTFDMIIYDQVITVDWIKLIYALLGAMLIAFVSGIIPSSIASNKQPIDALRNE
jgi:putative ABC transport system permease protein